MRWIEWLQRRPLPAAALVGLVLGLLVGLAWPIPDVVAPPVDPASWTLPPPAVAAHFDERAFAKLRSTAMWGATGSPSEAAKLPAWRLTGIISRPAPTALVLAEGSTTLVRAHLGDTLPDGGRVVDINPRGIAFERKGCRYQRVLYAPVDPAEAAGCTPAGAATP